MGKIICLMGKSSTGKDTIFKRLLADQTLGLQTIVSYTTRPIRDGECEGIEYFFTDEAGFARWKEQGRIIERGTHDQLIEQKGKYYQLYTGKTAGAEIA